MFKPLSLPAYTCKKYCTVNYRIQISQSKERLQYIGSKRVFKEDSRQILLTSTLSSISHKEAPPVKQSEIFHDHTGYFLRDGGCLQCLTEYLKE